ncbi:MAG: HAD-IA family hydrolase [Micrococcales bacterium]
MKFYASGLLFDNDGVLVDSHAAAAAAWKKWCAKYAPHINWDTDDNAGVRAEDKVREWIASPDLFKEANDFINGLEQDSANETLPLPGAVELTTSLNPAHWTICTSANANLGRARIQAAGIPVPPALVTGDDVKRGKPHPDPYLLGAERLGFDPADCVVFEDAIMGAQAAEAAGVGLIVGIGPMALEGVADVVVKDLAGITFDGELLYIPDKNRLR